MRLFFSMLLLGLGCGVASAQTAKQPAKSAPAFQLCERAKDPQNYFNDWVTEPLIAIDGQYLFSFDPAKPAYAEMYDADSLAALKRLTAALKSRGTQLFAIVPPNRAMAFAVDRKNAVAAQDLKTYGELVDSLNGAGIPAVNLLGEIAARRTTFDQFYLKRDVHWSQTGAEYTAGLMADLIRQQPAYKTLPKTKFTLSHGNVVPLTDAFAADIRKACGTPVKPETSRYTQLKTPGRVGLTDEMPPASVVIVGTSFTESKSLNFADFFSADSGLAAENYAVEGARNYDSFMGYLASDSYRQHQPKFILWESLLDYPRNDQSALRQLIAGVYGPCKAPLQKGKLQAGTVTVSKSEGEPSYLTLDFAVSTVKNFTVNLQYEQGREAVKIVQIDRVNTRGKYFLELKSDAGALKSFSVTEASAFPAKATYALCQTP